jgi:hypothetical protein
MALIMAGVIKFLSAYQAGEGSMAASVKASRRRPMALVTVRAVV